MKKNYGQGLRRHIYEVASLRDAGDCERIAHPHIARPHTATPHTALAYMGLLRSRLSEANSEPQFFIIH